MLFTAWRNEDSDLLGECETYMERCQQLREQINEQLSECAGSGVQLAEVLNDMECLEYGNDECVEEQLASSEIDTNYDLSDDLGIPSSSMSHGSEISVDEMEDDMKNIADLYVH